MVSVEESSGESAVAVEVDLSAIFTVRREWEVEDASACCTLVILYTDGGL